MIDADEHKKLLAQIAELEKNSINYFDVEKEFFLIDSDNLSRVHSKLYGYSIQRTGIYEDDNLTAEAIAGLDGRGCYVYVDVKNGKITITQDFNGCWGIYLFRHGDYFALSNSFFRLVDYIKFKYPLTVNRDYCHYLLINDVCSHAYYETAINEIQLVDRSAIILIDSKKKTLDFDFINYREHSVSLDSQEGVYILDDWLEFWSDVLNGIAQHTNFIQADLSGGFDSRISMIPLLHSSIDCNKIKIHSAKGKVHTFAEDYEIATQIANHYGFKLHQPLPENKSLKYSFNDIWNFDFYGQQTFHKIPYLFSTTKTINKFYSINGYGGETIRNYWYMLPEKFIGIQNKSVKWSSNTLSRELSSSIEVILKAGFRYVQEKYGIQDQSSPYLPQYLYQETRCRHHFGRERTLHFFKNNIMLSPIIDPKICKIRLNTMECTDFNLLIALIFVRYEPDLLKFPFEGNRSIAPETIEYAKKINERFPCHVITNKVDREGVFYLQPRDLQAEKILAEGKNNPSIPANLLQDCLKAMFNSSRTYGLFTAYFDEELYRYAATYYEKRDFGRSRLIYSVVGVTRVLEDVEISQRNHSSYQYLKRFLEQDFARIHIDEINIPDNFKAYLTARIDIQLMTATGDFQILSCSDDKATIRKPTWFQKNGIGYQIQSYSGKFDFSAKATVDERINLNLLGVDVRAPKDRNKRIPYWIDYTKLIVNGEMIFDTLTPAWHNKPYEVTLDAKANEEIKIHVEWQPHRSDT